MIPVSEADRRTRGGLHFRLCEGPFMRQPFLHTMLALCPNAPPQKVAAGKQTGGFKISPQYTGFNQAEKSFLILNKIRTCWEPLDGGMCNSISCRSSVLPRCSDEAGNELRLGSHTAEMCGKLLYKK